jgi:uncharacterized protein (TIGR03437 family)
VRIESMFLRTSIPGRGFVPRLPHVARTLLLLLANHPLLLAQPVVPPTGIYCSCGPTTARGHSLMPEIAFTLSSGALYLEVWDRDLVNPELQPAIASSAAAISSRAITSVSAAATFPSGTVAPGSLAVAYGVGLANQSASAPSLPLATRLGSTTVALTDSASAVTAALLHFVSPTQVNFVVPNSVAAGSATISITSGTGSTSSAALPIEKVRPGIFTANQNGSGVAAAQAILLKADGALIDQPVYQCGAAAGSCTAVPIDMGVYGDTAFLILYATGVRNRTALSAVTVTADDVPVPVEYAGPAGGFPGLDQINRRLPRSLSGRGPVNLKVTVDGSSANPVTISVR